MPLKGLKIHRGDKEQNRRSTFEPYNLAKQKERDGVSDSLAVQLPDRGAVSQDGGRPRITDDVPIIVEPPQDERPDTPPIQPSTPQTRRFSMLRFRHASDSHLSVKAKEHAARLTPPVPAMPAAPQIITTAPTNDADPEKPTKKPGRFAKLARRRMSFDPESVSRPSMNARKSMDKLRGGPGTNRSMFGSIRGAANSQTSLEVSGSTATSRSQKAPGETGRNAPAALAPPDTRASDSSPSDLDGSSGSAEHVTFVESQQRPSHQLSSNNSFFRLPRRNKNRASLFPLPVKITPPERLPDTAPATPRASTSAISAISNGSPHRSPVNGSPPRTAFRPVNNDAISSHGTTSPTRNFLARQGHPLLRNDSTHSTHSARSSPMRLSRRGRSSTVNSTSGRSDDMAPPTPPFGPVGRNSTSTAGRSSLSTLFGLGHRTRQHSEPHTPHQGGSTIFGQNSHHNSMSISRDFIIPEREEGEAPSKYLERLQEIVHRSQLAVVMSKKDDQFSHAVLRSYMRKFPFFGEPMDMAVRKLLMEVTLPKETQQIDRVVQSFADRYHECNPGIYSDSDQAYFIAFSIVIMHTDIYNKNNKRKMQRADYIKITSQEGVSDDVLGCFYDNTAYTPFIHFEDGLDHQGHKKSKKAAALLKSPMNDPARKAIREPIDPYTLILDNRLEILRPPLKDVVNVIDPYTYGGTAQDLDVKKLHTSFAKYGVLQIVSARSRPDAFMNENTINKPEDAQAGVVEMHVTKVGILLRKDVKKRTTRSPWQEWGAILTRSGLSFFKNANWVKDLMHQYESHEKHQSGSPVVFTPAIPDFKADHMIPMDGSVSLMDTTYKNHKNTFAIFSKSGIEELFRADSEADMNDWLGKLNYTATFETSGIRPRGLVGGSYEGQRNRGMRRLDSSASAQTLTSKSGEVVTKQSGQIDRTFAQQIMTARREVMQRKIAEAEEKIQTAAQVLNGHERDARHLLILAPVQPKTREQIVHAAGRMSAKLKWVRIEIWRMKCHRDILLMDLEEERTKTRETEARIQAIASNNSPSPQKGKTSRLGNLGRLNSKASSAQMSQKSPLSPTAPSAKTDTISPTGEALDDIFRTPPHSAKQSPASQPPGQWELPPLAFSPEMTPQFERRGSFGGSSAQSPRIPSSQRQGSISTIGEQVKSDTDAEPKSDAESRYETPDEDKPDRPVTPRKERQGTASGSEQETPLQEPKSPESRSKVRRSLHRTLRESHGSSHRRSGKGKESSSTIMSDEGSESLARREGSFTIHGKKASVINFGSEWQNMSAEERLAQTRRQTQSGRKMSATGTIESDYEGRTGLRPKPASIASNSTTTADNASLRPPPRHASPSRSSITEEAIETSEDEREMTDKRPMMQGRASSGKQMDSDGAPSSTEYIPLNTATLPDAVKT